jgi:hypothetical protein
VAKGKSRQRGHRAANAAAARTHRQRPPECCRSHWAAAGRRLPAVSDQLSASQTNALLYAGCWDCQTLELAETVVGLAELYGWGSCGVTALSESHGQTRSVLDCLIAAEEQLLRRRVWHTRAGRIAAGGWA